MKEREVLNPIKNEEVACIRINIHDEKFVRLVQDSDFIFIERDNLLKFIELLKNFIKTDN